MTEMEREVAYLSSQPSSSTFILFYQSDTLAMEARCPEPVVGKARG
jgi:hypothetical protein